ncbi:MAG: glycosyltransferase [Acidobacteriaceae bacterium]|nr:glycosyltransferase [Acidobacteriaceae bacterium]
MRVAIVHHWFVSQGGGERVAEVLAEMYPSADLFTLVADPKKVPPSLRNRRLQTSLINRLPFSSRIYRNLLPLYPTAVERLDLRGYDLVLSSDSGPMKGVTVSPSAVHICYCHSPMRYLWDQYHHYRRSMGPIARATFGLSAEYVREWDQRASRRVTQFIANSRYVASRIREYYGRESVVIHPPVETSAGHIAGKPGEAYLTVGRLVPYKRIDLLIQACNILGRELRIIGTGPEESSLRALAGKTIKFLGNVDEASLWHEYANCRAFLFGGEEDFGMAMVEAQSCGRPVIAFGKGGALEAVVSPKRTAYSPQDTCVLFDRQSPEAVIKALLCFEAAEYRFDPLIIRRHAERFGVQAFRRSFRAVVDDTIANFSPAKRLEAPCEQSA